MTRTRVKICGITDEGGVEAASAAGADAVGFVFAPGSPRTIEPERAFSLASRLPPFVASVGLFVDPSLEDFCAIEERCPTDFTQFHGAESVDLVRQCGPRLIKAVRYDGDQTARAIGTWQAMAEVDALLLDGSSGGKGEAFDWGSFVPVRERMTKPLIVAGGLTPETVGRCIEVLRPFGVDVSSGVESEPGKKDPALIDAFCRAVREADRSVYAG